MGKPTPGPWTIIPAIEYDGDEDELEGAIIDPAGIEGANGDPVCSFGSLLGSGTLYENEADYHLIAAAPDMLAALHNASWLLADLSPDGLVKKQIDEVIARATPETTP